jgi:L-2-hydroxyglutarate oxidase LhgO
VTAGTRPIFDVAVVGAGLVGLATASHLLQSRPELRLVVVEKEPDVAGHQSGHNSGVVHAGLYYPPGSLKAILCREGKAALEAYCQEKGIPLEHPGKLVVALSDDELPRLAALHERATANGVPGLELVGPERIREIEPHAAGIKALWSPSTGIVDFRRVAVAYADDVRAAGGSIETGREVTSIEERPNEMVLRTGGGVEILARAVVTCAGLWADRVAAMTRGADAADGAGPRIVPFRGDYYTLKPGARSLVNGLLYPVPDPSFPFLGVHFTKRIDGEVWAGPNAVLAFARDGYRRRDISPRDLAGTVTYPGFLRLATRYLRTGLAEMWRDWSKGAFLLELQRYLPELRSEDIAFGPSGVRAQALARDGTMVDDFDFAGSGRILHVRNAPSPAATASLAIGRVIADRIQGAFAL